MCQERHIGCSLPNPALKQEVIEGIRTLNDTYYSKDIKEDAVEHFNKLLPHAAVDKAVHGEGFIHAWNGIVGLTTDEVPFLGPVDDKPGQFVCGGFNGHGTFACSGPKTPTRCEDEQLFTVGDVYNRAEERRVKGWPHARVQKMIELETLQTKCDKPLPIGQWPKGLELDS